MPLRLILAASAAIFVLAGASAVIAQTPTTLGYTGFLTDDDGPVDYPLDIEATLYFNQEPTPQDVGLWSEFHADVNVMSGVFAISLGRHTTLDPTWFEDGPLYLELVVDGDVMTPRVPLEAVPYAFHSMVSDEALSLAGFDPQAFQPRFSVNCETGSFVESIDEDGTVICGPDRRLTEAEVDEMTANNGYLSGDSDLDWDNLRDVPAGFADDVDNDTQYSAGTALDLHGGTFSVDRDIIEGWARGVAYEEVPLTAVLDDIYQARVGGTCVEGWSIRQINTDGTVVCTKPIDVDTTYEPGDGLLLDEFVFSVDPTYAQLRVTDSCDPGFYISAINEDGTIECAEDVDTDTNTTYGAGSGLILEAGSFRVDVDAIQARIGDACPAGSSIRSVSADGTIECEDDNDTTYDAGTGLSLDGSTFSVDVTNIQARIAGTCAVGSSIRTVNADGTVECEDDNDTTYDAGDGLALDAGTFSVDVSSIQARIEDTCPAGSSIRTVNADGTVVCEDDTDTTYDPGIGLSLDSGTFNADLTTLQARIGESCPSGWSIRAINADGTVDCEEDTDTNTTYDAGAGLSLDAGTFSVDATAIQARIEDTCPTGSSIRTVNEDGTVVCEDDTDTTYDAGAGLALDAGTFSVDETTIQARVDETCPDGSSIRAINEDGTVECEVDTDNDTIYNAGAGLDLDAGTFSVDVAEIQARVGGTCPAGSSIRTINADGTVVCEDDTDTDTTYTASTGLLLNAGAFSVNLVSVQARVGESCPTGWSIRQVNEDGTVDCEQDTDTTYSAGAGLALNAGVFSVNAAEVQSRVDDTCPSGSSIRTINADGTVVCETDDNTTYSAGTGLALNSGTFSVNSSTVQSRVLGSCSPGWSIRQVNQDGSVVCEQDTDTDTNTTYGAGNGLNLSNNTFSINTSETQARVSSSCSSGWSIRTINADGTVVCEFDTDTNTTYSAGYGINQSGTTFSIDNTETQERVDWYCVDGYSIRRIYDDGFVECEYDDVWPPGNYCILRNGGSCPAGFTSSWIYWDDEDIANTNDWSGGDMPDASLGSNTRLYFCCK